MKLTSAQIDQLNTLVLLNKKKYPDWRLGQNYFNSLYEIAPDIANQIRGTEFDPFYVNKKIQKFLQEIC